MTHGRLYLAIKLQLQPCQKVVRHAMTHERYYRATRIALLYRAILLPVRHSTQIKGLFFKKLLSGHTNRPRQRTDRSIWTIKADGTLIITHADDSRGGTVSSLFVCVSVYLHDITKTAAARITKRDRQMFHRESWKPIYDKLYSPQMVVIYKYTNWKWLN